MLPERLNAPQVMAPPAGACSSEQHVRLVPPAGRVDFISDVFAVMGVAHQHVFQVTYQASLGRAARLVGNVTASREADSASGRRTVWMGPPYIESQKYAPRLSVLRRVPATVRFVSAEPLGWRVYSKTSRRGWSDGTLHWVILAGGRELAPAKRPPAFGPGVGRATFRDQSEQRQSSWHFFVLKQLGGKRGKRSGSDVRGTGWRDMGRNAEAQRTQVTNAS